jgi:hypothetical protein
LLDLGEGGAFFLFVAREVLDALGGSDEFNGV